MQRTISGVVVHVVRRQAKAESSEFLFLLRSGGRFEGQWWPVAGTCEPSEEPLQTALRELKEETGLSPLEIYSKDQDVEHLDDGSGLALFVAFVPWEAEIELNYEHTAYKWLSAEEMFEIVPVQVRPHVEDLVRDFIDRTPDEAARVY